MTHFIDELRWRGLLHDITDEAGIRKLEAGSSFYVGFDPTAPSLQVGNLVALIAAIHIARSGIIPLILFGGATGAIGDPSGKNAERQLLDRQTIDNNLLFQTQQVRKIFERAGITPYFVNNLDWTRNVTILEFLRDIGKYFTVNYMLAKDVVKTRLDGEGISYTEFSYMLLQSFDFLHLFKERNCRLQLGGSDQWGNITAGLELIRKKLQGEAYALSWPLLTNAQGKKFGKSEGGAIWLDPERTSPFRFHQFWLQTEDADAARMLRIFTFLTAQEIEDLEQSTRTAPEQRRAQRALADAVCDLVHGPERTQEAKRSAEVLFGGSLDGIEDRRLEEIFADVPSSLLPRARIPGMKYVELLVECGLAKSKGEARRLVQNGGAYLNNQRVSDAELLVEGAAGGSALLILRSGKKAYHLVKLV